MINLFDMMRTAQNGEILDVFGKQFGLTNKDVEKTLGLMMPAFAKGVKLQASSPADFAKLMQNFSSANFMNFQKNPKEAFRDDLIEEGNSLLEQLFGSSHASQAIADQVALASGVGPAIIKKMMPAMATFMAEGINNNFQQSAPDFMDMGDFWKNVQEAMTENQNASGSALSDTMMTMMNWPQNIEKAMQQENPFLKMMQDFWTAEKETEPETEPESREEAAKETPKEVFESFIDTMFETGQSFQEEYQKNLDKIFSSRE